VPAPEPREPRIPGGGAAVVLGTTLVGAMAALIARGAADTLRRPRDTDLGKVLQPVALQALTWAVVGAAVAMWLALLLGPRRAWLGRVFAGAFTGAVAGAGSAAIGNGPRYLIHPTPADSTIKLLTVVGLGVTGALIGALVGWAWRRRASVGLSAGLVAGVLLKLVLNGSDWGGSRSATACLEAAVIIGSAAATLALLDAREGASSRAPASVGGR
jgi:hypothetical protein